MHNAILFTHIIIKIKIKTHTHINGSGSNHAAKNTSNAPNYGHAQNQAADQADGAHVQV